MIDLVLQLTKGIIRDHKARRSLMFYLMVVALLMLFVGWVFISETWARAHVWLYFGYWAVCAWFTLAAMLLAVFDMLIIRASARVRRRRLEEEILGSPEDKQDKK